MREYFLKNLQKPWKKYEKEDMIMGDIKNSAVELIGNTPILQLHRYTQAVGVKDATILAKLEYLNPAP